MSALLDVALENARRGWHVFPCWPKTKKRILKGEWNEVATTDEAKIREWWAKWPAANVAIAPHLSGLVVLDCDHGNRDELEARAWMAAHGFPETYTVRTGRRAGADGIAEYGVQMYFQGDVVKTFPWAQGNHAGEVRCRGAYVMAAGSVHPDSGEAYEVAVDAPVAPVPAEVFALPRAMLTRDGTPNGPMLDDGGPITDHRNMRMISILGRKRAQGFDDDAIREFAFHTNETRVEPPLPEGELERLITNACRYPVGGSVEIALGRKPGTEDASAARGGQEGAVPRDWRTLFHTTEEFTDTADPVFLIYRFLQDEAVCGLIGPARARKSIIVLNLIHALLTGKPLFGHHEVTTPAERVVYLCPESGFKSLAKRIRNTELLPFIGKSLFVTSMNSDPVKLSDPALREAVRGSVVFIDTAIRFFDGDENSSQDMKLFGGQCHALIRDGVRAVVLLHHNAKGAEGLTLEGSRGSGDFGGFLTCCWATTLDNYEDAYNSPSLLACVKQRDFRAESFRVVPSGDEENFFLQYVGGSENAKVQVGSKAKPDQAKAAAFIRANPDMTAEQVSLALKSQGIDYSPSWCRGELRKARAAGAATAA